jgi:hypothetical protein
MIVQPKTAIASRKARRFLAASVVCLSCLVAGSCVGTGTNVVVYHQDALRTGWNDQEGTLTPGNVQPGAFGLITSVALDDQVDAEPLVVGNQTIAGAGSHTVVYVATEGNTVYAIDGDSGTILKSVNLGTPVPAPAMV